MLFENWTSEGYFRLFVIQLILGFCFIGLFVVFLTLYIKNQKALEQCESPASNYPPPLIPNLPPTVHTHPERKPPRVYT